MQHNRNSFATDSVKRRLKFLRPSPTVTRGQNSPRFTVRRAKTTSDENLPLVAFQIRSRTLPLARCRPSDMTAEVHEEESWTSEAPRGSPAVSPASGDGYKQWVDDLALHSLSNGLELQLDLSNVSLRATSPQELCTSMSHDATHGGR